jgi:2'-5' RNA ligase superfamily
MKSTADERKGQAAMGSAEHELAPEEQDWHRFRQFAQLTNHWERPGWTDDRKSYHWLLALGNEPELAALARRCQASLGDFPTLDLVPPDALRLTLQRVGFTDEVDSAQLQALADTTARRCADHASFELRIGWLAGSQGAIRFTAFPLETVVHLRQIVLETLTDVCSPTTDQPTKSAAFWPHVSIAYCNMPTPAMPIIERVAYLRSLPPVPVRVQASDLVELRRESRAYRWEIVARTDLWGGVTG